MEQSKNEKLREAIGTLPDAFEQLKSGEKVRLRRARHPDELEEIGGFYRLCAQHALLEGNFWQMKNLVFFLPWVRHFPKNSLGAKLSQNKTDEQRLFQVMRSEYPNDLLYLSRCVRMVMAKERGKALHIDWKDFGLKLYYWGERSKRSILQDYYVERFRNQNKNTEGANDHDSVDTE